MSETLRLTVVYEDAGAGWTMASIPQLPAVLTQGATIDEARAMIRSGLRDWLEFQVQGQHGDLPKPGEGSHSEPLDLVIGVKRSNATSSSTAARSTAREPTTHGGRHF